MYSYTSWSHDSVVVLCNRGAPILWIDTCIFFWEVLLYHTLLFLPRQHGFQGSIIYDLIGWLFALPCRRDIVVVVFINCFIYLHFQTSIATGDRPTAASYNYEGKIILTQFVSYIYSYPLWTEFGIRYSANGPLTYLRQLAWTDPAKQV